MLSDGGLSLRGGGATLRDGSGPPASRRRRPSRASKHQLYSVRFSAWQELASKKVRHGDGGWAGFSDVLTSASQTVNFLSLGDAPLRNCGGTLSDGGGLLRHGGGPLHDFGAPLRDVDSTDYATYR